MCVPVYVYLRDFMHVQLIHMCDTYHCQLWVCVHV